jgi:hypothetical protein
VRFLLDGARREGTGLGRGYVDVGGHVLALTPVGAPRMPNGVECDLTVGRGERVTVGEGAIRCGRRILEVRREWDPVPRPAVALRTTPDLGVDTGLLAGRGPGLTPMGDDLLVGYVAGLVLFHGRSDDARSLAEAASPRTTALSATLLRHAARGELPEPAHRLLEDADPAPLLHWGRSSGRALLVGLAIACGDPDAHRARRGITVGVEGGRHRKDLVA